MRDQLRRQARRVRRAVIAEWHGLSRRLPVRADVVLYESFAGNGMLCNPEALFRELLADPGFSHLRHVWVLASRRDNPSVVKEFAGHASVRFVRPHSFRYFRALATSGYLVNNATFPPEFGRRAGQVYLNTWHGTPLKRMGYDIGDPASRVANVIRNFLSADYLLSASGFMTEHLYERAHLLGQISAGLVVEEGYPRLDRQQLDDDGRAQALSRLERSGVHIDGRRIILYAPTWKGTSFSTPEDDIAELASRIDRLESLIDSERYVVLLKTHQIVHRFADGVPGLRDRLVPNELPSNTMLGVTDILVTDYSSIFFDFLATGRPILFLTPDIADYAGYRGLYIEPDEWPGPVVATVEQLAEQLVLLDESGPAERTALNYAAMKQQFTSHDDGSVTRRVIDIVFRGRRAGYAVAPLAGDGRRTLLVYGGSMAPGDTTSRLLEFLDGLDHGRLDVTLAYPNRRGDAERAEQSKVHPSVRQMPRVGSANGSRLLRSRPLSDEWLRCYGDARFDLALDFDGTSPFWAGLMLEAPGALRMIRTGENAQDPGIRSLLPGFDRVIDPDAFAAGFDSAVHQVTGE